MFLILTLWISLNYFGVNEVAALDECRTIEFIPEVKDKVLENHVIRSLLVPNKDVCEISCYREPNCVSYNYGPTGSEAPVCELSDRTHLQVSSSDFVWKPGYIYRYTKNLCQSSPCLNNAKCQAGFTSNGYRCICSPGYQGDHCETVAPLTPVSIQPTTTVLPSIATPTVSTQSSTSPSPMSWPTCFEGSCYKLFAADPQTWYNAKDQFCANQHGAQLVKIESADENNFIKSQFLSGQVDYWIGLSDSSSPGVWKWADGDVLGNYTNWAIEQPSHPGVQHCVGIRHGTFFSKPHDAQWHDTDCTKTKGYICEK